MVAPFYLQAAGPALMLMKESCASEIVEPLQRAPGGGVVRVIRGWKCGDLQSLHNELGAALQFPEYYGENWNAADECIRNLKWLPGNWYLVQVCAVQSVLPEDPQSLGAFLSVLSSAHEEWHRVAHQVAGKSHPAVPFHTIMSGSAEGLARVKALAGVGVWAEA